MLLLVFTTTTGVDDDNCRHSTTTTTMDAAVAQSMTMKTLMLLIYNLEHCLTGTERQTSETTTPNKVFLRRAKYSFLFISPLSLLGGFMDVFVSAFEAHVSY